MCRGKRILILRGGLSVPGGVLDVTVFPERYTGESHDAEGRVIGQCELSSEHQAMVDDVVRGVADGSIPTITIDSYSDNVRDTLVPDDDAEPLTERNPDAGGGCCCDGLCARCDAPVSVALGVRELTSWGATDPGDGL
jgi:hypothetical protein